MNTKKMLLAAFATIVCAAAGMNLYINHSVKMADAFLADLEALAFGEGYEVKDREAHTVPCDGFYIYRDGKDGTIEQGWTTDPNYAGSFGQDYEVFPFQGSITECTNYSEGSTCMAKDCSPE